ncbi:MAG: AMP-binding protein [Acidimicrobiia bacterium]
MTATLERDLPAAAPGGAPRTLPALLAVRAGETPDRVALRSKELGRWVETTWSGYAERVARIAAGLRELGVQPGDKVSVHSENRIEWLLADLAVQGMGAVTVGIYPTRPGRGGRVPPVALGVGGARHRGRGAVRQGDGRA